jgi:Uma2 family endonuclease
MPPVPPADVVSIADLLRSLGNIAPSRVRLKPTPGTATERDVLRIERREGRLYELVDGTLVEKVMGLPESYLAGEVLAELRAFAKQHELGFVAGEAGMTRLLPGLVRIPDVAFYSWKQVGKKEVPADAIGRVIPDLAVEVVSKGNTRQEIQRKFKEYFLAGTRLAWIIDARKRQARVHTAPDKYTTLDETGALDGGAVLPGFTLPLRSLFALLPPVKKPSKRRKPA